MYVFGASRTLEPSTSAEALHDSVFVFEGEFTVNADKAKIVDTVLGLWALCLSRKGELLDRVNAESDRAFPREYFGDLPALLEAQISGTDLMPKLVKRRSVDSTANNAVKDAPVRTVLFDDLEKSVEA